MSQHFRDVEWVQEQAAKAIPLPRVAPDFSSLVDAMQRLDAAVGRQQPTSQTLPLDMFGGDPVALECALVKARRHAREAAWRAIETQQIRL